jgi:two-component system sensor histidine kinase VicK
MQTLPELEKISLEFKALQQIGEVSSEGIFVYSVSERKILYANAHVYDLLGLKTNSSRLDIESIFELVIPQDKEYVKNQYSTVAEKSITGEVEFQLVNAKKQHIFVCCNAFLIAKKSTIVVFIKNITRAKEHQDYLVEFGARKNTVLTTLTHHISGALKLMQHLSAEAGKYIDVSSDKNLKIYLDLLDDNSSRCLEIIYDILKNEHSESPGVSVKTSRIDIIQKVSFIYDELKQSYLHRKFLFQTSTDSLYINIDEVKLLQVVNNLTSNAIKFSPVDETIIIAITETATDVIVWVKDRGIGIPDDKKPLIFQTQLGVGRKGLNGEKSIGLGLSICNNLVQIMNGKIWFESKEGEGSTFYISLPKE